ncbi:MAG TPA: ATP-dependent DNA helicase, partial [Terriglobia bacterium]|nr:ATP-dependent DNA helicase [Terriglobia bacterium]
GRIRARRGARLAAITSGGAIPDTADYQVIQEPEGVLVGTVNEDFAIESIPGDIFLLGNTAWKILRLEQGTLRVEDAHGEPPTIPFWLGEAPARTAELSAEVSALREEVAQRLEQPDRAAQWLMEQAGLTASQAAEVVEYLAAARAVLGVVPTQKTLVLERFFDATGGMQLVVHAPFGGRINRAWGLALRKRFCRSFNFELQAAANEDAIVLSLGLQHSFPLEDVFSFLHSKSAEQLLVQALLAAPMFLTRWRWNAMRSLAILRHAGGRRVPPALLRMKADDLLAAVFPDSAACLENITGDIEIPDHPLVRQTLQDCLTEAMDLEGFLKLLGDMEAGNIRLVACDTTEPSPLAHEILNARPYAFLDDAPLEERRTRAVQTRRALDYPSADELGTLDPHAIELIRQQAAPQAENAEELHDALLLCGFLAPHEHPPWRPLFAELAAARRAAAVRVGPGPPLWIAAERKPQFDAVYPGAAYEPDIAAPAREMARAWRREEALVEIVRGRLEISGPITERALAASMRLEPAAVAAALLALEKEGGVLRGRFSGGAERQWCDRRLLARIHRAMLDRLRKEIEPVSAAEFLRFLFAWQHVDADHRVEGPLGLSALVGMLQGFEIPAAAWEESVLPARMARYDPAWMDQLCLSGELAWLRLYPPAETEGRIGGAHRSSPVTLLYREQMNRWLRAASGAWRGRNGRGLGSAAQAVLEYLESRGACFFQELTSGTGLLRTEVENGLRELIAAGWVTGDGFAGLRALAIAPAKSLGTSAAQHKDGRPGILPVVPPTAGRWSALRRQMAATAPPASEEEFPEDLVAMQARQLLRRYGVVFPKLLERESGLPPWRALLHCYRRLEARGEIRGGRFVAGFSGEQYALPEAVQQLRALRRQQAPGRLAVLSAADPLNLAGVITPGRKIAAIASNRVLFRDGLPVAGREGGDVVELHPAAKEIALQIKTLLAR